MLAWPQRSFACGCLWARLVWLLRSCRNQKVLRSQAYGNAAEGAGVSQPTKISCPSCTQGDEGKLWGSTARDPPLSKASQPRILSTQVIATVGDIGFCWGEEEHGQHQAAERHAGLLTGRGCETSLCAWEGRERVPALRFLAFGNTDHGTPLNSPR